MFGESGTVLEKTYPFPEPYSSHLFDEQLGPLQV